MTPITKSVEKMRVQLATQLIPDRARSFAPLGVPWLRNWLARFDLSKLSSISLREAGPKACDIHPSYQRPHNGAWGTAHPPPKRSRKIGWQLYCAVARAFPSGVVVPLPPIYRADDGTWAPTPSQAERFGDRMPVWDSDTLEGYQLCLTVSKDAAEVWADENIVNNAGRIAGMAMIKGKPMIRVETYVPLADANEAAVWIVTNLAYYWLRHTQQIPGLRGGKETAAALFACETLESFKKERIGA